MKLLKLMLSFNSVSLILLSTRMFTLKSSIDVVNEIRIRININTSNFDFYRGCCIDGKYTKEERHCCWNAAGNEYEHES
jgi:hypothetical protein